MKYTPEAFGNPGDGHYLQVFNGFKNVEAAEIFVSLGKKNGYFSGLRKDDFQYLDFESRVKDGIMAECPDGTFALTEGARDKIYVHERARGITSSSRNGVPAPPYHEKQRSVHRVL